MGAERLTAPLVTPLTPGVYPPQVDDSYVRGAPLASLSAYLQGRGPSRNLSPTRDISPPQHVPISHPGPLASPRTQPSGLPLQPRRPITPVEPRLGSAGEVDDGSRPIPDAWRTGNGGGGG
eukprot:CAMPEP_0197612548 /NCGR_PEP_ID=MMETSP1326-20131121/57494_1 /TAXON_ID=1155430 /ORGANISM="Genus nov. species nov., Strain RCC2288" /LENGTH=120 /DNA_ID=CAMNT_0043181313 /DNA_START=94 /DNA_END=452 /DNA_ORIENTATION=+